MRLVLSILAVLFTLLSDAQTASRLVTWRYDFARNPQVTGFELLYYSNGVSNLITLPLVTNYAVTLNLGQWYDFQLCAVLPGIKSLPATARHLALPAAPEFIRTNLLLTVTNAMFWQRSADLKTWDSAAFVPRINVPFEWPARFYRLAGGAAASNKIIIERTL